jgi:Domain of unknown function (DUF4396)
MNHQHQHTHHHVMENSQVVTSNWKLAFSATVHCLIGCGLGEVLGMVIGTWLHMNNTDTMILAILLGFVLGFAFGMFPLLKAGFSLKRAFRQVLIAEGLSIAVMEMVEVLVQVYTPGVMDAHLHDWVFWKGMLLGLLAGFIAAYPVNYLFIRKGVRHVH